MASHWITHKFGGTSLADAAAYRIVAGIVADVHEEARQAVVVSAAAGVTDSLIRLTDLAAAHDAGLAEHLTAVRELQAGLVESLAEDPSLIEALDADLGDIENMLRAAGLMASVPANVVAVVAGFGEVWSARLLTSYLRSQGHDVDWLDAREVLVVGPGELTPVVDWEETDARLGAWLAEHNAATVVITGYIASDAGGAPTTLGRNGSDLSASIFGALLDARQIVIWTDVDGVLSADPRLVPAAHVLDSLSYNEAMELAYFGAKVIHPATMTPAVRRRIPIVIRNTFNTASPGTRIEEESFVDAPVKGFASIGDMALVNLEGTAMIGVPGISERLFGALRSEGVSVVMISQGSSEHSICFAIPESHVEKASRAVERAFAAERQYGLIQDQEVTTGCTILAAVGDSMSGTPGVAARLFGSLARVGINVRAIAQGASERNISVVIDSADATKALRAAHSGFYLSDQTLSIGVIGPGHVGATLLDQMARRLDWLEGEYGVDLRVRAIASSKQMALDEDGIGLGHWRTALTEEPARTVPTDLDELTGFVRTESVPHAVIIDCTADASVADRYADWLEAGIHVITPNKKAGSGDLDYYRSLMRNARRSSTHFLYETTVGAALPIVQTLRDLVQTGDEIRRIQGVFSGTLSYLFNNFDGSTPFSGIVAAARDMGYTEPDPREDLSGLDVARKVVILAREMGMDVELADVSVEGLVSDELERGSVDDFLARLPEHDQEMLSIVEEARSRGEVLRFVGVIDPVQGCSVSLRRYRADHPFAGIKETDNIVQFETARYNQNPLVVQGPGAGPEVTAGGVFADLLRLANYLGARL
jgi:aspartokinase/homoserine dehydrogenase 1